jgi:hypothetical protein
VTTTVKKGDTVWVVNRELVRKGRGPLQHVVGEVLTTSGVPWCWQPRGTRGVYSLRETYTTKASAVAEARDIAVKEIDFENAKHEARLRRLKRAWNEASAA